MKNSFMKLMTILLPMILSSCVASRQYVDFPNQGMRIEDPEKARIYVIRPSFWALMFPMRIIENRRGVGKTGPRGYLCWETQPGPVRIIGKACNEDILDLEVEKSEVYYLEQTVRLDMLVPGNKLDRISEYEGKRLLKKCKGPQ